MWARSPSATSVGSLMKPRSTRDAHTSTVCAPRSANRASVPPHASDSSSGWAKTARIVRPSKLSGSPGVCATVSLHEVAVNGHVFLDHAIAPELGNGALTDARAIDAKHARQTTHHLLQIVEHHAGQAFVHHFAHSAAVECGHGRTAGHRLCQDEPERFAFLNRIQERACPSKQLHFRGKVRLSMVNDL